MNKVINQPGELVNYFLNSFRCQKKFKIGAEFEKLGVFANSGRAIPYRGKRGVATLLSALSHNFAWKPFKERDNIVALSRDDAHITLEPGGQIELSTSVLDNIHQIKRELKNHLEEIKFVSEPPGIKWLGLGIQPVSDVEDIEWVPKERYRIMAPYMARHGTLSHHMMKKTASIQVCVDYSDEKDFAQKMRTILALVPLTTAVFANSPISQGKLNGFLSKRAHIWNRTDPLRCGLIEKKIFFNPGFSSYVNYALEVPMLFIVRDNQLIEVKNITFSRYLKEGYQGYRATLDDWEVHLSTIFTEVRARRYIEVRNADCQRLPFAFAIPALWKGILYNKEAMYAAWSLVKDFSWEERCWLYSLVPRKGLKIKVGKFLLLDLAKKLLKIAYNSLKEQREINEENEDESIYLEPLMELIIESEICPAEVIIKNWENSWHRRIDKLISYSSY